MKDVADMFPDDYLHLGHDEVVLECWDKAPAVREWLRDNANLTSRQALRRFLLRAHGLAASKGRTVMACDEAWELLGSDLPRGTVVQQSRWGGDHINRTKDITGAGYRLLFMVDPTWYRGSLDVVWNQLSLVDVCETLSTVQCELVMGGGAAMWVEHVDNSNIQAIVWPRLAAVAEALWSPSKSRRHGTHGTWRTDTRDTDNGEKEHFSGARLKRFQCLLNRRGVKEPDGTHASIDAHSDCGGALQAASSDSDPNTAHSASSWDEDGDQKNEVCSNTEHWWSPRTQLDASQSSLRWGHCQSLRIDPEPLGKGHEVTVFRACTANGQLVALHVPFQRSNTLAGFEVLAQHQEAGYLNPHVLLVHGICKVCAVVLFYTSFVLIRFNRGTLCACAPNFLVYRRIRVRFSKNASSRGSQRSQQTRVCSCTSLRLKNNLLMSTSA